jgi:hypothetical protein
MARHASFRVLGAFSLLIGIGLIALGLLLVTVPDLPASWLQQVISAPRR